ncbi:MAG: hypothetical protein PHT50_02740 [Candidatus Omnitrophica bacterium]|nr:hypothetical protein [Candidatus Omnitrophota bacterium]
MLKKILCVITLVLFPLMAWAAESWEKKGDYYFLAKTRDNFALEGAGPNIFASKYLAYGGVDFLVRGESSWQDYGRLDLEGNNMFSLPIRPGMKVEEVHFLAGGNYSNSYEHDASMRLFGDKYFYATLSVIFAYEDGTHNNLSVPVFWDWFDIGIGEWSKNGATIKSLGENPVRQKCSMFHIIFVNPRPMEPVKDILVADSWIDDRPFSDVFAVTIKSSDTLDAAAKGEK